MQHPATTIDDVLARLRQIIDHANARGSTMGYFAALYHRVTAEVKQKIAEGYFDDGGRMERLDVRFANRYLEAYNAYQAGRPVTRAWQYAFDAAGTKRYIVLQHLFLGMNAHINLDLGIAAAETAPGEAITSLENDFKKINTILTGMIDEVEQELATIWPVLHLLDRLALRTDETLAAFSMEKARDAAWGNALALARSDAAAAAVYIDALDKEVIGYAALVAHPGPIATTLFLLVRVGERGSVTEKIAALDSAAS
ncbi:DUF5995 family protein [Sulfurimonas diazotrophicus]|uniref:DUF5995 family protein n=1 Tax=Sulfurimonas diazotrophicus TaxID=3131939 RepID=A0ABZ3H841_9BACT